MEHDFVTYSDHFTDRQRCTTIGMKYGSILNIATSSYFDGIIVSTDNYVKPYTHIFLQLDITNYCGIGSNDKKLNVEGKVVDTNNEKPRTSVKSDEIVAKAIELINEAYDQIGKGKNVEETQDKYRDEFDLIDQDNPQEEGDEEGGEDGGEEGDDDEGDAEEEDEDKEGDEEEQKEDQKNREEKNMKKYENKKSK